MNAYWMATRALIKRARNLVAGVNLVKSKSAAIDQLFPSDSTEISGLLGPGGNLVMLVTVFRQRGRALPPCAFQPRPQWAAVQTWSGGEKPVRTSPSMIDQESVPRVPQTRALHGDADSPVTLSAFAGGAQ